jgi:hypothetical protein
MKLLKFECSSDDTFGEYMTTGEDIDNCGSGEPMQCLIRASEGSLYVVAKYGSLFLNGCWCLGVMPYSEDEGLPHWNMRITRGESDYSPAIEIEAPDDVELQWFKNFRRVK